MVLKKKIGDKFMVTSIVHSLLSISMIPIILDLFHLNFQSLLVSKSQDLLDPVTRGRGCRCSGFSLGATSVRHFGAMISK